MKTKLILGMAMTLCLATAVPVQAEDLDAKTSAIIKRDFRDKGIAKADRVNQDELQAACSKYMDDVPVDMKIKLEDEQLKTIKWPTDGNLMGD